MKKSMSQLVCQNKISIIIHFIAKALLTQEMNDCVGPKTYQYTPNRMVRD